MLNPCNFCSGTPRSERILPSDWVCEEVEVTPCIVYVEDFQGVETPDVQPFTSLAIQKPDCCEITLTFGGNTVVIPENTTSRTFTFECEMTDLSITGDCLDTTIVTVGNCIPAVIETVCTRDPSLGPPIGNDAAKFPCKCL